ncbi:MAG: sigma-54 dependent transcriptional regulator [Planctomycetota bacterium]|nr:sigma-54 dependent transcriptional regulator [Planctomycetota bacterium]
MAELSATLERAPAENSSPRAGHGQQVLIVDDTPANLDLLSTVLEPHGYRILAAPDGQIALGVARRALPDLIILDIMMPGKDGFATCRELRADPATAHIPVLFVSARGEASSLLEAFAAGGIDFISKPFNPDEVLIRVRTHLKLSQLARQLQLQNQALSEANELLRREVSKREQAESALAAAGEQLSSLSDREAERWGIAAFVGKSKTIQKILTDVRRLQNFSSVNVLISGESGTGKELVARAVHFGSARSKGPFIPVNCVAIPHDLAESMLFGHVRGAFTGATMDRKGFFELAHGGTLFLDEIGDMPAALQAKLLRVLEDGRVTPLGSTRDREVDVRVVAATNVELPVQMETGAFRQDLYFRLAQFTVDLPPLRQRAEDIPLLASHFLELFTTEMGIAAPKVHPRVMEILSKHPFPGNVRELKNVIERALIESGGSLVQPEHIHLALGLFPSTGLRSSKCAALEVAQAAAVDPGSDLPLKLEAAENILIKRALLETNGNIAEAARRLGVNRTRIYRKLNSNHGRES